MMLVTPFFAAISLLLPVASSGCSDFKKFETEINVNSDIKAIEYDYSLSKAQLDNTARTRVMDEWQDRQGDDAWSAADLEINGYTRGAVNIRSDVRFRADPYDTYGRSFCPYVQVVNIDVTYNSKIYIARELKRGACLFREVKKHELKHHKSNVNAVNNVVKQLKYALADEIKSVEGPAVSKAKIDSNFNDMKAAVRMVIKAYNEKISAEMIKGGQSIDTIEEYERVVAQCK